MTSRIRLHRTGPTSRRFSPTLVVGALAFLTLVLLVGRADNGGDPSAADLTGEGLIDSMIVLAVNDLGTFVAEPGGEGHARFDHSRTAEGLRRLAAALDAIFLRSAPDTVDFGAIPAELRDAADLLARATKPTAQANIARGGFVIAAEAVSGLQAHRYVHLQRAAEEMRDAAGAIRSDRPLLDQGEEVRRFFDRAYDAVRAMSEIRA